VRAYILVLTLTLAGCTASEIVQNWTAPPAPDLSQPDHRRIVGANIKRLLPYQTELGELEISEARLVDHLKGPAWLTCLKLDARGNPRHYAIFIKDGKIIDTRASVVIDQCHKASYTLLEIPTPAKKPGT